jgi:hypothetical protein
MKLTKLNSFGIAHIALAGVIVLLIAVVGTFALVATNANSVNKKSTGRFTIAAYRPSSKCKIANVNDGDNGPKSKVWLCIGTKPVKQQHYNISVVADGAPLKSSCLDPQTRKYIPIDNMASDKYGIFKSVKTMRCTDNAVYIIEAYDYAPEPDLGRKYPLLYNNSEHLPIVYRKSSKDKSTIIRSTDKVYSPKTSIGVIKGKTLRVELSVATPKQ